jgi:hypothetical protein
MRRGSPLEGDLPCSPCGKQRGKLRKTAVCRGKRHRSAGLIIRITHQQQPESLAAVA